MKRATAKRQNYALPIIILAILISVSGILLARAFYSSEPDGEIPGHNYAQETTLSLAPYRGGIYDRNHRELAINATGYSVYAHPLNIEDPDQTAAALSNILRVNKRHLLEVLKCERAFVWIARGITFNQVEMIMGLELKGVRFSSENYRAYPRNELAAQVIGFTDSDGHGVDGLELAYDHLLYSTPLSFQKKPDELTQLRFKRGAIEIDKNRASNIVLTLDRDIQALAERELCSVSAKHTIKAGTIMVMDVEDGAVLAMANYPSYNPNVFWEAKASVRRNRAITDTYELGELINFFGDVAAREEQSIQERSTSPTERVTDPSPAPLPNAIEPPSPEFLYNFILKLGFGSRTGIGLPAEDSGTLPAYDEYKEKVATLYRGEGITVTPLQIMVGFGAILNRGQLMRPRLVMEVTDSQGNLISKEESLMVKEVCAPETSEKIRVKLTRDQDQQNKRGKNFILVAACNYSKLPDDSSPGDISLDKSPGVDYIQYTLGYVPANNPKVAVLTVIEAIREEGEKGLEIECKAENIAHAALKTLTAPRAKISITPYKEKKRPVYDERDEAQSGRLFMTTKAMVMPDVRGKCMREALCMLQGYDLSLIVKGSGVAVYQSPAPGTKIQKASRCVIEFKPL